MLYFTHYSFIANYMGKRLIMAAAFIAFLLSVYLWFTGDRDAGIFVGLWVPSILALGNLKK